MDGGHLYGIAMGQVGDGAGIDFSIFPEGFPQQDAPVGNQSLFSLVNTSVMYMSTSYATI